MTTRVLMIKARDVVPGMELPAVYPGCERSARAKESRHGWDSVTRVRRIGDRVEIRQDATGALHPLDENVLVQLPGPSPRELLCSCVPGSAPSWGGWWKARDPAKHVEPSPPQGIPCPVAPNYDRERGPIHGGLRLWPVGGTWTGAGWSVPAARDLGYHEVLPAIVSSYARRGPTYGWEEGIFMEFCEPPAVPDLPTALERRPTPWAPYDEEVYR